MRVTGTDAAARIVERAKRDRRGALVFTIGTGCCESTAPFLYEDFWPGPDSEQVGEVDGVPVYAPEYLRALYPAGDGVVIDVVNDLAESMSIETEYGCRFVLRDGSGTAIEETTAQRPEGSGARSRPRERETTAQRPEGSGARSRPIKQGRQECDVPDAVSALRSRGSQELPEALRRVRMR